MNEKENNKARIFKIVSYGSGWVNHSFKYDTNWSLSRIKSYYPSTMKTLFQDFSLDELNDAFSYKKQKDYYIIWDEITPKQSDPNEHSNQIGVFQQPINPIPTFKRTADGTFIYLGKTTIFVGHYDGQEGFTNCNPSDICNEEMGEALSYKRAMDNYNEN